MAVPAAAVRLHQLVSRRAAGQRRISWARCFMFTRRLCLQMQYGSIGWSVGALLGYQRALQGSKRVLAFIGDGSFQVTAQVRCCQ